MNIPVITAGHTASAQVPGLEKLRGPVTVVRRCEDLVELVAACQGGIAKAAIVGTEAGEITTSVRDRLRVFGVALVVLTSSDEEHQQFDALGVCHDAANLPATELAALVYNEVEKLAAASSPAANQLAYSNPAARVGTQAHSVAAATPEPAGTGRVVAVWGPTGAPGRTTIAVNFAAELAATGESVLLLDADTYGASVAASLGLLEESAGLAQACRLAGQGPLTPSNLERALCTVFVAGHPLQVLTGLTRPERWPELRPAALEAVIGWARQSAGTTVIDCGFCLEADEELSFDTPAPRRNGAALRSLELADTILAVGAADAIGVPRLVRALSNLSDVIPTVAPRVVLNKVRRSAVGRSPERQLREAWDRFGPPHPIAAFLPADPQAVDEALLGGSALLECCPQSELRMAIASLAGVPVEAARRRFFAAARPGMKFPPKPVRLSG